MKKTSQMSKDFNTKRNMLRECRMHMADGGPVRAGLAKMDADIDNAVRGGPKPVAKPVAPVAKPAEPDDSAIGIHIPKPAPEAPKPKPSVMDRLRSIVGMAEGGFIDDGEEPEIMRGVPQNPKTFAKGGVVQGPGTGTSDSVPAMLSKGEFVLPADTVRKVGAHNLEALRKATHTPVHMADGGESPADYLKRTSPYNGYVANTNQTAATGASFAPAQTTADPAPAASPVKPATGDFSDARDLQIANTKNGQYGRAQDASDAMDNALQTAMAPTPPDTKGEIRSIGNTFYGRGPDTEPAMTTDQANASARAQMDAMDQRQVAARNAGIDQNLAFARDYDARQQAARSDADFKSALRDPTIGRSVKANLLAARGQDIQQQANQFNRAVTMRGQDIGAQTAMRGQDVMSNTAANEQATQRRGQDLTAYSNYALRNLQAQQYGHQLQMDNARLGLEQGRDARAAQEQGYQNLMGLAKTAHTQTIDGKEVVDAQGLANTTDKVNHTAMNLLNDQGIDVRTLPPQVQNEFVHLAQTATNADEAAKGFMAKFGGLITGRNRGSSRDLRDYVPQSFEPGAVFPNLHTNVGNISPYAYKTGDFSAVPGFNNLEDVEKTQRVGQLMQKLRKPN